MLIIRLNSGWRWSVQGRSIWPTESTSRKSNKLSLKSKFVSSFQRWNVSFRWIFSNKSLISWPTKWKRPDRRWGPQCVDRQIGILRRNLSNRFQISMLEGERSNKRPGSNPLPAEENSRLTTPAPSLDKKVKMCPDQIDASAPCTSVEGFGCYCIYSSRNAVSWWSFAYGSHVHDMIWV